MKLLRCIPSPFYYVVAIVASVVACLSCIKENLYLIQFIFFPSDVYCSNLFCCLLFLFSFFSVNSFFFSFLFSCNFIQSLLFARCFVVVVSSVALVCLHPKTMFVEKTYSILGMKVCFRNHVESIFSLCSNHRCHFDTFVLLVLSALLYHLLTRACAGPSVCFYFWHVREEYKDDDI